MERRDFIKQTAALASLTAVGGIASADAIDNRSIDGLSHSVRALNCNAGVVLVDGRFSDSRRFADAFASRGAIVMSLAEDIGRLWYGALRTHCLQSDGFVAGLTLHTDLFVSQTFARECGKRFVQFGEHDCRGQRTLTHTLVADAALDLRACESWAEEVAGSMMREPLVAANKTAQPSRIVRSSDHPGSLYSWLIV